MFETLPILDHLQDSFDPITQADIGQLEMDLGVEFPSEYRDFLLAFNAGYWRHDVVACRVRNPDYWVDEIRPDMSLGIIPDDRFLILDIRSNCATYCGRVRDDLIPIMHSLAHPIFMATSPQEYGTIYVWDQQTREDAGDNLFLLSDSFGEFLRSLYAVEDDEFHVEKLPVFQAVERGMELEVRAYLADGGKVDCRNAKDQTLLMCAARNSWPRLVRLLLENGGNPNAIDGERLSPLYHAIWGQSNDSVKLLLAAGADSHSCDPQGRNLAQYARESHHYRQQYTIENFWQRQRSS